MSCRRSSSPGRRHRPGDHRLTLRLLLLWGMAVAVGVTASGCSGACGEAKDICTRCELEAIANCDRYDELDSDACEEAITSYENNCPDA